MTHVTCTNKSCTSKPTLRAHRHYREVSGAVAAGGILILATIIGAVGFGPTILIGAIAAVIGGTVVFGSNTSTLKQTVTDMKAAEAHRAELISRMNLRVVGDGGEVES